jgi:mRNA-degrading endonuclease RelE of RelBE toxin-antitoxin system
LRLRAWRVLYNLEDNDQTIVVIRVLHRREAYRRR